MFTLKNLSYPDPYTLTLRLFVAMVENYISSMVHSHFLVLCGTFAKLVNTEKHVFGVGDSVNVILKYIDAERVEKICKPKNKKHDENMH